MSMKDKEILITRAAMRESRTRRFVDELEKELEEVGCGMVIQVKEYIWLAALLLRFSVLYFYCQGNGVFLLRQLA
jgi:hypothetical protein